MALNVYLQRCGTFDLTGRIDNLASAGPCFSYSPEYLADPCARPISASLQLSTKPFDSRTTRRFFQGLLPEGTGLSTVAHEFDVSRAAYSQILKLNGWECIGAILIADSDIDITSIQSKYEPISFDDLYAISYDDPAGLVSLQIRGGLSLPGAQDKAALFINNDGALYKTHGLAASSHIVKAPSLRWECLSENEFVCMKTAEYVGLDVADSDLLYADREHPLFITKRYDRVMDDSAHCSPSKGPLRLHQEDFTQALSIDVERKYEDRKQDYLGRASRLIENVCFNPINDKQKFFENMVFSFVIGNTDNHFKNYSLLWDKEFKCISLSPAYDIVATSIYPGLPHDTGFFYGSHRNIDKISHVDFVEASKRLRLTSKQLDHVLDKIGSSVESSLDRAHEELMNKNPIRVDALTLQIEKMKQGVRKRKNALTP